jgi:hypothetical protein
MAIADLPEGAGQPSNRIFDWHRSLAQNLRNERARATGQRVVADVAVRTSSSQSKMIWCARLELPRTVCNSPPSSSVVRTKRLSGLGRRSKRPLALSKNSLPSPVVEILRIGQVTKGMGRRRRSGAARSRALRPEHASRAAPPGRSASRSAAITRAACRGRCRLAGRRGPVRPAHHGFIPAA